MQIVQQIVNGLMLGGIYVGVAVAFTLTIGILNFLNFTIPALFMLAGMVGWQLSFYGLPFGLSEPMGWLPALGVGVLCAIVASLVVERFTYRYMKAKHGDATEHAIPLVSSLGFLLIFEYMILIAHGSDPRGFHTPLGDLDLRVAGLIVSVPQLLSLAVSLAIVAGLSAMLTRSRLGRALRATAENPDAAVLLGVRVGRIVPVVFILTGLLCGLAGALFAVNYGEVNPFMGEQVGTKAIAGMVLGGLGSVWGAIAGGLLVGLTETLSIYFFGATSAQVTIWGLLLVILLIRPQGLFGHNAIGKGKF